jgi:putative GTP pyrophosphokinase
MDSNVSAQDTKKTAGGIDLSDIVEYETELPRADEEAPEKRDKKETRTLLRYLENHLVDMNVDKYGQSTPEGYLREMLSLRDELTNFQMLMMHYECAMSEVQTKIEVLDRELAVVQNRNPIESIKSRIKTPRSIFEKLDRRGIDFTVSNIERYLQDIAGIRVICSFIDDIYKLRDCLIQQDDIILLEEKDYIRYPKNNGYRSLHLILEVPIYLTSGKYMMKVELQLRTIAMDFWASIDHKMKYKRDIPNEQSVTEELLYVADMINQLDRRMIQLRDRIDKPS